MKFQLDWKRSLMAAENDVTGHDDTIELNCDFQKIPRIQYKLN